MSRPWAVNRIPFLQQHTKNSGVQTTRVIQSCPHLSRIEQGALKSMLRDYQPLFDGTLGDWKHRPHDIKLKEGVQPYHGKAYPVPKCHEQTLKEELARLVRIGVLKRVNHSEWGPPHSLYPKRMAL